jgi:hypothetical protein
VLALAGVDVATAVVFGLVYAAAGHRILGQAAFLAAVAVVFWGATALWLHVERGRGPDPLRRLGRVAGALAVTWFGLPALVLTPLFGLREGLSPEAGLDDVIRPALVLLLASLALTALVNAAGLSTLAAASVARRLRAGRSGRP